MKVIILRGIPGSGKSTYARRSYTGAVTVSADDFFLHAVPNEKELRYDFDPKLLPVAHADCFRRFLVYLHECHPLIIVDNTNVHIWEWHNYKTAAELVGYQVQVIGFQVATVDEIKLCWKRNMLTHHVPLEVIAKMAVEWEPAPEGKEKLLRVWEMDYPEVVDDRK